MASSLSSKRPVVLRRKKVTAEEPPPPPPPPPPELVSESTSSENDMVDQSIWTGPLLNKQKYLADVTLKAYCKAPLPCSLGDSINIKSKTTFVKLKTGLPSPVFSLGLPTEHYCEPVCVGSWWYYYCEIKSQNDPQDHCAKLQEFFREKQWAGIVELDPQHKLYLIPTSALSHSLGLSSLAHEPCLHGLIVWKDTGKTPFTDQRLAQSGVAALSPADSVRNVRKRPPSPSWPSLDTKDGVVASTKKTKQDTLLSRSERNYSGLVKIKRRSISGSSATASQPKSDKDERAAAVVSPPASSALLHTPLTSLADESGPFPFSVTASSQMSQVLQLAGSEDLVKPVGRLSARLTTSFDSHTPEIVAQENSPIRENGSAQPPPADEPSSAANCLGRRIGSLSVRARNSEGRADVYGDAGSRKSCVTGLGHLSSTAEPAEPAEPHRQSSPRHSVNEEKSGESVDQEEAASATPAPPSSSLRQVGRLSSRLSVENECRQPGGERQRPCNEASSRVVSTEPSASAPMSVAQMPSFSSPPLQTVAPSASAPAGNLFASMYSHSGPNPMVVLAEVAKTNLFLVYYLASLKPEQMTSVTNAVARVLANAGDNWNTPAVRDLVQQAATQELFTQMCGGGFPSSNVCAPPPSSLLMFPPSSSTTGVATNHIVSAGDMVAPPAVASPFTGAAPYREGSIPVEGTVSPVKDMHSPSQRKSTASFGNKVWNSSHSPQRSLSVEIARGSSEERKRSPSPKVHSRRSERKSKRKKKRRRRTTSAEEDSLGSSEVDRRYRRKRRRHTHRRRKDRVDDKDEFVPKHAEKYENMYDLPDDDSFAAVSGDACEDVHGEASQPDDHGLKADSVDHETKQSCESGVDFQEEHGLSKERLRHLEAEYELMMNEEQSETSPEKGSFVAAGADDQMCALPAGAATVGRLSSRLRQASMPAQAGPSSSDVGRVGRLSSRITASSQPQQAGNSKSTLGIGRLGRLSSRAVLDTSFDSSGNVATTKNDFSGPATNIENVEAVQDGNQDTELVTIHANLEESKSGVKSQQTKGFDTQLKNSAVINASTEASDSIAAAESLASDDSVTGVSQPQDGYVAMDTDSDSDFAVTVAANVNGSGHGQSNVGSDDKVAEGSDNDEDEWWLEQIKTSYSSTTSPDSLSDDHCEEAKEHVEQEHTALSSKPGSFGQLSSRVLQNNVDSHVSKSQLFLSAQDSTALAPEEKRRVPSASFGQLSSRLLQEEVTDMPQRVMGVMSHAEATSTELTSSPSLVQSSAVAENRAVRTSIGLGVGRLSNRAIGASASFICPREGSTDSKPSQTSSFSLQHSSSPPAAQGSGLGHLSSRLAPAAGSSDRDSFGIDCLSSVLAASEKDGQSTLSQDISGEGEQPPQVNQTSMLGRLSSRLAPAAGSFDCEPFGVGFSSSIPAARETDGSNALSEDGNSVSEQPQQVNTGFLGRLSSRVAPVPSSSDGGSLGVGSLSSMLPPAEKDDDGASFQDVSNVDEQPFQENSGVLGRLSTRLTFSSASVEQEQPSQVHSSVLGRLSSRLTLSSGSFDQGLPTNSQTPSVVMSAAGDMLCTPLESSGKTGEPASQPKPFLGRLSSRVLAPADRDHEPEARLSNDLGSRTGRTVFLRPSSPQEKGAEREGVLMDENALPASHHVFFAPDKMVQSFLTTSLRNSTVVQQVGQLSKQISSQQDEALDNCKALEEVACEFRRLFGSAVQHILHPSPKRRSRWEDVDEVLEGSEDRPLNLSSIDDYRFIIHGLADDSMCVKAKAFIVCEGGEQVKSKDLLSSDAAPGKPTLVLSPRHSVCSISRLQSLFELKLQRGLKFVRFNSVDELRNLQCWEFFPHGGLILTTASVLLSATQEQMQALFNFLDLKAERKIPWKLKLHPLAMKHLRSKCSHETEQLLNTHFGKTVDELAEEEVIMNRSSTYAGWRDTLYSLQKKNAYLFRHFLFLCDMPDEDARPFFNEGVGVYNLGEFLTTFTGWTPKDAEDTAEVADLVVGQEAKCDLEKDEENVEDASDNKDGVDDKVDEDKPSKFGAKEQKLGSSFKGKPLLKSVLQRKGMLAGGTEKRVEEDDSVEKVSSGVTDLADRALLAQSVAGAVPTAILPTASTAAPTVNESGLQATVAPPVLSVAQFPPIMQPPPPQVLLGQPPPGVGPMPLPGQGLPVPPLMPGLGPMPPPPMMMPPGPSPVPPPSMLNSRAMGAMPAAPLSQPLGLLPLSSAPVRHGVSSGAPPVFVSVEQPMSVSPPQLMSVSAPQPMSVSTPQLMSVSAPQPMSVSASQSMSVSAPQPMSISAPQPMSVSAPQPMSVSAPQPMLSGVHSSTPSAFPSVSMSLQPAGDGYTSRGGVNVRPPSQQTVSRPRMPAPPPQPPTVANPTPSDSEFNTTHSVPSQDEFADRNHRSLPPEWDSVSQASRPPPMVPVQMHTSSGGTSFDGPPRLSGPPQSNPCTPGPLPPLSVDQSSIHHSSAAMACEPPTSFTNQPPDGPPGGPASQFCPPNQGMHDEPHEFQDLPQRQYGCDDWHDGPDAQRDWHGGQEWPPQSGGNGQPGILHRSSDEWQDKEANWNPGGWRDAPDTWDDPHWRQDPPPQREYIGHNDPWQGGDGGTSWQDEHSFTRGHDHHNWH